jgi:hypothetical protein
MLYLFVFGPAVEEGLGAFGYLVLYMGAGVVSGLAQVAIAPGSMAGVVGASGAIAAPTCSSIRALGSEFFRRFRGAGRSASCPRHCT